jgi:Domain of unknown function (DUF397)
VDETSRLTWQKSSFSDNGGNCVEVASTCGQTYMRDSKRPEAGHVGVTPEVFAAFLASVKAGDLDL